MSGPVIGIAGVFTRIARISSTATLGCAIFAMDRLPDARKVRKSHSQEWLCYENRSLTDFFRSLLKPCPTKISTVATRDLNPILLKQRFYILTCGMRYTPPRPTKIHSLTYR